MLVDWLRKHSANKAVLEASGGYERDWTKVLRRQVPDGPAEQTASDEALTFTTNGRLSTTVAWIQHQAMRP
jgi:hypothetical protein